MAVCALMLGAACVFYVSLVLLGVVVSGCEKKGVLLVMDTVPCNGATKRKSLEWLVDQARPILFYHPSTEPSPVIR